MRVCSPCRTQVEAECFLEQQLWKRLRVAQFVGTSGQARARTKSEGEGEGKGEGEEEGYLLPYRDEEVDNVRQKVSRAAHFTIALFRRAVFSWPLAFLVTTIDLVGTYGQAGLAGLMMSSEFITAAADLKRLSGLDKKGYPLSLPELTACIYYRVAVERGQRAADPGAEDRAHVDCPRAGLSGKWRPGHSAREGNELGLAIYYAPFALNFAYHSSVLDAQRLGQQLGYSLLFVKPETGPHAEEFQPEEPFYMLYAHRQDKNAVLTIRGTYSVEDVVTDMRATPESFPPSDKDIVAMFYRGREQQRAGYLPQRRQTPPTPVQPAAEAEGLWTSLSSDSTYASSGICRAAAYMIQQVGPSVVDLLESGFCITVTGHSLGGAVAALVTLLLRRFVTLTQLGDPKCISGVTYSCPSFVDERTADLLLPCVTSIVVRDDVVSRITPASIRTLMQEMLSFRKTVSKCVESDYRDLVHRLKSVWRPRMRHDGACHHSAETEEVDGKPSQPNCGPHPDQDEGSAGLDSTLSSYVLVDEEALPALFVPGTIMHLYSSRGQWQAVLVSRSLPPLRKVQLQPNMFKDHFSYNVFSALQEAASARLHGTTQPPVWMPFDHRKTCQCCDAPFSWHSTFQSDYQTRFEGFNCHSCGASVCRPCASNRAPVLATGMLGQKRICDRCFVTSDHVW